MTTGRQFAAQAVSIIQNHSLSVDAAHAVHASDPLADLVVVLEPIYTETSRALRAIKTDCLRRIQHLDEGIASAEPSRSHVIDLRETRRIFSSDMAAIDRELDAIIAIKAALRRLHSMADDSFVTRGRIAFDQQMLLALADARSIGAVSQVAFDRACEQVRQPSA